jgi:hypothetical protein
MIHFLDFGLHLRCSASSSDLTGYDVFLDNNLISWYS